MALVAPIYASQANRERAKPRDAHQTAARRTRRNETQERAFDERQERAQDDEQSTRGKGILFHSKYLLYLRISRFKNFVTFEFD